MTNSKTCSRCGELKVIAEFQKRKASNDGLTAACKSCLSDYDKVRHNKEERIKACGERYKTLRKEGSAEFLEKDRERCRKYRKNNPLKYQAQCCVSNALRDKLITRPNKCINCGSKGNIQGHHWSYEEEYWLDVIWLCTNCHAKVHEKLRDSGSEL